nr:phosphatase PAP2 family protein [Vibrio parahaemolyticus]
MMRFDSRFVYRLFFAITATSLMVLVAQQGFSLPRPHVYVPMAELPNSYGFSFPSLPIAVWFCVLTFLFQRTHSFGFNSTTVLMAAITLIVMLCKFFLGSAFILDMLLGALLGILVAWHVLRLETNPEVNVDQLLSSKRSVVYVDCCDSRYFGDLAVTCVWQLVSDVDHGFCTRAYV